MNTSKQFYQKKILITGGAGHIGSDLISEILRDDPLRIVSIDNYSNGLKDNETFGCEYKCLSTENILEEFDREYFDYVFHFGEYARVEQSFNNIDEIISSNILGTKKVIDYFNKNQCGKLIYSCSSAITSMNELNIINSPYVLAKKFNRDLLLTLQKIHQMKLAIVYFSNVYGGREKSTGENATVVAKFLRAKKLGEDVCIHGDGKQTRNFTHISDVISALRLVAASGTGDGYVIGAAERLSIIELAELIGVKYTFRNDVVGNRSASNLDLSKMKALGWSPKVSIRNYLSKDT